VTDWHYIVCPVAGSSSGPCEDETGQQIRLKWHILIRTDCSGYECLLAVGGRELTACGVCGALNELCNLATVCCVLCVLCGAENKQRLSPSRAPVSLYQVETTILNTVDMIIMFQQINKMLFNLLKPTGHVMHQQV
jgi:hypothetical protein